MLTGLISELDAINKIIAISGDSPVQTLEDDYIQAKLARQILTRASRDLQSRGWWFNEEQNVPLVPDINGYITLAPNIISFSAIDDDGAYVQRGTRIYNRTKRSYVFSASIEADLIVGLDWNELPQSARAHIVDIACEIYNNDFFGAEDIKKTLKESFYASWLVLKDADTDSRDINLLRKTRIYNIAFKNRRG